MKWRLDGGESCNANDTPLAEQRIREAKERTKAPRRGLEVVRTRNGLQEKISSTARR